MPDEATARRIAKLFGVPTGFVIRDDPFTVLRESQRRYAREVRKLAAAQNIFNRVLDEVIPPADRTG